MIRAATIADTVSAASSILSYSASIVCRAAGRGTSFSSTSVMMPSVPSEPTNKSFSE